MIDYETKPLTRKRIRLMANIIRTAFKIESLEFPAIKMLDILEQLFGVNYDILPDDEFGIGVMAYFEQNDSECSIYIRESVYNAACNGSGKDIGFITHEISHFFLIKIFNFGPIYRKSIKNKKIPAYKSIEWQAKALCGELMIPYNEFKNASIEEICEKTNSSYAQAEYFINNVVKK